MKYFLAIFSLLLISFIVLAFDYGGILAGRTSAERKIDRAVERAVLSQDPLLCLSLVERIETPASPDDAKGAPHVSYPRDACLQAYVLVTHDITSCVLMSPPSGRSDSCYSHLAEVYSDPVWCQYLSQTPATWKVDALCRAKATLDVRECDTIIASLPWAKAECISAVATRTHNYTDCLAISYEGGPSSAVDRRNGCLRTAGCNLPDQREEICELITYPDFTLPEEVAYCVKEDWACPVFLERIE